MTINLADLGINMAIATGIYRHYKGQLYRVLKQVQHSETEEEMVVYQTLYGDHSYWCRPLEMFNETIDGQPRFARLDQQSLCLEVAHLRVKPGLADEFQVAFKQARAIIDRQPGCLDVDLRRQLDDSHHFLLQVAWINRAAHEVAFRSSNDYQQWAERLHKYYEPMPRVEYFDLR